jgi:hypothetical protein
MARPGLDRHPKFRRLCLLLQAPRSHCRGYLELLWDTAYENGDPIIGDETDVALAADFPGDPKVITQAMLNCGGAGRVGLIEEVPGRPGVYQVHDLYDHAPEYVRKRMDREAARRERGVSLEQIRSEAARQAANARWARDRMDGAPDGSTAVRDNASCLPDGIQRMPRGTTPAPAPAPKEKTPSPTEKVCSEPATPASEPPAEPSPKVVMTFPIVGQKAKTWDLTESKLAEYRESFPGVDVLAECRKALQWARDTPEKRKTARGMPRILTRWLSKAQDEAARGRERVAGPERGSTSRVRNNLGVYDDIAKRCTADLMKRAAEREAANGDGNDSWV